MSHRPIEQKKRRRVAKALRRSSLPAYFDLWTWLIQHGHAKTRKEAREVILAKRVKANSHTLGVTQVPKVTEVGGSFKVETVDAAIRYVSTEHLPDLVVAAA